MLPSHQLVHLLYVAWDAAEMVSPVLSSMIWPVLGIWISPALSPGAWSLIPLINTFLKPRMDAPGVVSPVLSSVSAGGHNSFPVPPYRRSHCP